jgi:predicted Zn finger-like uncharacterized protein
MQSVSCPNCSQRLKVTAEAVGKRVKCSSCGRAFMLPDVRAKDVSKYAGVRLKKRRAAVPFAIGAGIAVTILAIACFSILAQRETAASGEVSAAAPKDPQQLDELKGKRDRIAAEYQAAVAERDRLAPPPGMDSPEKVRRYYEGRARIEEAEESVHEAEDMRIRADALTRIQQRNKDGDNDSASLAAIQRENDKIMRDAETAIYRRKVERKKKALAAAEASIEETKKRNAARERATSEMNRLRNELETLDHQIQEWGK